MRWFTARLSATSAVLLSLVACQPQSVSLPTVVPTLAPPTSRPTDVQATEPAAALTPVPLIPDTPAPPTQALSATEPVATATLAPEPDGSALGTGPFLFFLVENQGCPRDAFVVAQDGLSQWQTQLLDGCGVIGDLGHAVSPDQRYLVMYRGNGEDDQTPYDLRLNVLDLRTGRDVVSVPLLSPRYPEDLHELWLKNGGFGGRDHKAEFAWCQWAFSKWLPRYAWSPDGNFLAFAGQMDGPASNLYVLDLTTLEVRRLTATEEEVLTMKWSPGGRYVLTSHTQSVAGSSSAPHTYLVVDPLTAASVTLPIPPEDTYDGRHTTATWLDDTHLLIQRAANSYRIRGAGLDTRLFDVDTGALQEIWPGTAGVVQVDFSAKVATFQGCPVVDDIEQEPCSAYRADLTTLATTVVGPLPDPPAPLREGTRKNMTDREGNRLTADETTTEIATIEGAVLSFDSSAIDWWSVHWFILAPDRGHLFLQQEDLILVVDLSDGHLSPVGTSPWEVNRIDFVWLTAAPTLNAVAP